MFCKSTCFPINLPENFPKLIVVLWRLYLLLDSIFYWTRFPRLVIKCLPTSFTKCIHLINKRVLQWFSQCSLSCIQNGVQWVIRTQARITTTVLFFSHIQLGSTAANLSKRVKVQVEVLHVPGLFQTRSRFSTKARYQYTQKVDFALLSFEWRFRSGKWCMITVTSSLIDYWL